MPIKTSSGSTNKKLTDFFVQRPSASASASGSSRPVDPTTTAKRPATRASKAAVDRQSSTNGGRVTSALASSIYIFPAGAPPQLKTSAMTTRKRARSTDSIRTSPLPVKLKSTRKLAGSDCATALINSTLSRSSLAHRPIPVKVYDNTLVTSPLDSEQVVCSSQSDEAELEFIPELRDLKKAVEDVHVWRRNTFASSNFSPREDTMDVDSLSSSDHTSPLANTPSASPPPDIAVRPAATPVVLQTTLGASACIPSPYTNELSPLPPTPKPNHPEEKTAKLIANIKARAFAANQSSDDEAPLSFRELEDSDDGDLTNELPTFRSAKTRSSLFDAPRTGSGIFSSPLSSVPSTFDDVAIGPHTRGTPYQCSSSPRPARTSTRTRKPALAFRLPVTVAKSSVSAGTAKSLPSNRRKSQAINPLHALLREKRSQDKCGTSSAAFRLAEEAVRQVSHEGPENECDSMDQSCFADEQAAWKAVYESRKSTSPADPCNVVDFTIGERESKMLGAVSGEAINQILASDRNSKGKEMARSMDQKTARGVPLWIQSSDEDMEVDSMPIPPLSDHHLLICLDGFLERGDDSLLDLILRSGALAVVPRDILLSNIPHLLNTTLFASSQVADAVCIALHDLWGCKIPLPFVVILSALVRLGANPSTLAALGLGTEGTGKYRINEKTRLEGLKRLLAIVKVAGFAGAFPSNDVANVVLSLVILGLDPLTSGKLSTQLNITMDVVCNHGTTDHVLHCIHEKVLSFAKQLVPINKARLVSLFASGSGRTRCIARNLAYCLLVSLPITLNHHAPPLEPLILLLSPDTGSGELFDTNESTDYEELRHYVNILSVALVDIAPYVEEECATMKCRRNATLQGSPGKSKKLSEPPLELLRRVLEALQGRIVDTRASHLDRSRTKAAIQRLSMRINYDRMALTSIRRRRRASTLKAYFSPQRP